MIEHSPISILGTDSISVCGFDHPKRSYGIRMETRDSFDESDSWQMRTSLDSRRGPVASINRDTMMHTLTKIGAFSFHARMTIADNSVSNTMPGNGNSPGGVSYDSIIQEKEKNKTNM